MKHHRQYGLGYTHGLNGVRAFAHRQGRTYVNIAASRVYAYAYKLGAQKRRETGRGGLDYNNPLNNQLFVPSPVG